MPENASENLHSILKTQWSYQMQEFPEWATFVGYPGQNDRWTDLSLPAIEKRRKKNFEFLSSLRAIDPRSLSENDRLSHELAIYELEMNLQAQDYGWDFLLNTHMDNLQTRIVDVMASMPRESEKHWQDMLKRLDSFPEHVRQNEELMREGIKRGIMPFREFMNGMCAQVDDLLTPNVRDSALFNCFTTASIEIQNQAATLLTEKVYPALQRFNRFQKEDYGPKGRKVEAWTSLPRGKEWYHFLVQQNTTTHLTPEEIHGMGVQEVERINAEMEKIRKQVGFQGDRVQFREHLLTSTEFHFPDAETLLESYRAVMRQVDPILKNYFGVLPTTLCEVRAMPEFRAKTGPGGQYFSGSLETGRPGYFEANTHDLPSRPKWEVETLTLHETIPGHHFQISVAKEAGDLPDFRRNVFYTAYAEGWALYAESLGETLGLFKDPYSKYGYLSAEMLRSVRLVVDTGMHVMGWSRDKALTYFRHNVPATDHDSQNEINRYVTWPGQALGYKVGEIKIQALRRKATKELGDKFDLREFHDQLLIHGSLPLSMLEKIIYNWIETRR